MNLSESLVEAWRQALVEGRPEVELAGRHHRVGRTRAQGLRTISFLYGEHMIEGIEQNPEKTSRWAQLAREGKRLMQFKFRNRFFANVCEGVVTKYPAWTALDLPE